MSIAESKVASEIGQHLAPWTPQFWEEEFGLVLTCSLKKVEGVSVYQRGWSYCYIGTSWLLSCWGMLTWRWNPCNGLPRASQWYLSIDGWHVETIMQFTSCFPRLAQCLLRLELFVKTKASPKANSSRGNHACASNRKATRSFFSYCNLVRISCAHYLGLRNTSGSESAFPASIPGMSSRPSLRMSIWTGGME